ncbi:hypothetical protein ACFL43_06795 [Thermodesulfobacteriota bacterium]
MKTLHILLIAAVLAVFADSVPAEEKDYKQRHAEKVRMMEETFWAASEAGKTIKGVFVEGNSLFNGTTQPQNRPYGSPYAEEHLLDAKFSAERNSQVLLLSQDGVLYYPTVPKGQRVSQSLAGLRIPRVLTKQQKQAGLFTWATLVPLVGREVEVYGEMYPGYGGVKGIAIESISFAGEYIVGQ